MMPPVYENFNIKCLLCYKSIHFPTVVAHFLLVQVKTILSSQLHGYDTYIWGTENLLSLFVPYFDSCMVLYSNIYDEATTASQYKNTVTATVRYTGTYSSSVCDVKKTRNKMSRGDNHILGAHSYTYIRINLAFFQIIRLNIVYQYLSRDDGVNSFVSIQYICIPPPPPPPPPPPAIIIRWLLWLWRWLLICVFPKIAFSFHHCFYEILKQWIVRFKLYAFFTNSYSRRRKRFFSISM